jgi:eukaryotic-like serine/threonine-protein kinase
MPQTEQALGPTQVADPRIGRILQDRYKILSRIGEGAMGVVYRAERLSLGRQVAVKFLHAQLAGDPVLVKRFDLEAQAMSSLAHPNCVSVIDFGVDGWPYLVMDFVPGTSLRALVAQGPLPARRALRVVRQVLAALAHAHAHGIVHRDIKPENILVDASSGIEDHVRVLDFGLAKFLGSDIRLTLNSVLGTPNYMAPEMTREGSIDERIDLYAAGVVLFEILTGRAPFDAPDVGQIFVKVLGMPPPKLRQWAPQASFSEELESFLLRAMSKLPAQRFPSASIMVELLDALPEARDRSKEPATVAAGPLVTGLEHTIAETLPAFLRPAEPRPEPPPEPPRPAPLAVRAVRAAARRASGKQVAALMPLAVQLRRGVRWLGESRRWLAESRKRVVFACCAAVLGLVVLIGLLLVSGGREVERAIPAAKPKPAVPEPRPGKSVARQETRAAAVDGAARARMYFEKQWWVDGFEAYQAAVRLDPALKSDPSMLRHLISALQSEKVGHRVAAHLRDLGSVARPHLREAAKKHPNKRVRERSAAILKSSARKPLLRWPGRK